MMTIINFLGVLSLLLWSSRCVSTVDAFPLLSSYTKSNNNHDILSTATNAFKRQRHDNHVLFSRNNHIYGTNINQIVNDDDEDDDDDNESSAAMKSAITEANILRAQAEVIRAEARAMELALRERTSKQRKDRDLITDEIITEIFSTLIYQNPQSSSTSSSSEDINMAAIINDDNNNNNDGRSTEEEIYESTAAATAFLPDARVVADRLKHGKFSRQQILSVVDRLHEQYREDISKSNDLIEYEQQLKLQFNQTTVIVALLQASLILDEQFVANDAALQETTTNSSISTLTTNPKLSPSSVSSSLMTNGQLEKSIQSRILELQQQHEVERNQGIAAEINRIAAISDGSSGGNGNDTTLLEVESEMTASFIPMWIPSSFVPYIISLNDEQSSSSPSSADSTTSANSNSTIVTTTTMSTLGPTEVEIIKNEVLMGSRFYLTSFESIPGAALFR
jgi:hypothetical protein